MKFSPLPALVVLAVTLPLTAQDTAHEDPVKGEGGSFRLLLSKKLFADPRFYVDDENKFRKNNQPAPWPAGLKTVLNAFNFDTGYDIFSQHGHVSNSHILRVRAIDDSGAPLLTTERTLTPAVPIDIFLDQIDATGNRTALTHASGSSSLPNVRLVLADTHGLQPHDCVPLYEQAKSLAPAKRDAFLKTRRLLLAKRQHIYRAKLEDWTRRRKKGRNEPRPLPPPAVCADGHDPATTAPEDYKYSWVVLADRKLSTTSGAWLPPNDPNTETGERTYSYPAPPPAKDVRIRRIIAGSAPTAIELQRARCTHFQVCRNVKNANGQIVAQCDPAPALTLDKNKQCVFSYPPVAPPHSSSNANSPR